MDHGNNFDGARMPQQSQQQQDHDSLIDDEVDYDEHKQHFSLARQTSGSHPDANMFADMANGGGMPGVAGISAGMAAGIPAGIPGGIGMPGGGGGIGGGMMGSAMDGPNRSAPSGGGLPMPQAGMPNGVMAEGGFGSGPGPGPGMGRPTSSWQHHITQGRVHGMQSNMGGAEGGGMPRRNHSSDALDFMRQFDPQQQQQQQQQHQGPMSPQGHAPLHGSQNATFAMPAGSAQRSASMFAGDMNGTALSAAAAATAAFENNPDVGFGSPNNHGGSVPPDGANFPTARRQRSVTFAPSTIPGRSVGMGLYDQQNTPQHMLDGDDPNNAAAAVAPSFDDGENGEEFLSAPYQNMMSQYNQENPHASHFAGDGVAGRPPAMGSMANAGSPGGQEMDMPRRPRGGNLSQLPGPTPGKPAPPMTASSSAVSEPPRPSPKWSRRCAAPHRKERTPDVETGKQVGSDEELLKLQEEWQQLLQQDGHHHVTDHVVDCPNCSIPLQVRKVCTIVICPSCGQVSPAATCAIHAMPDVQ